MQHVLVTGANKGIGLAIVEAILREHPHMGVLLGSRDAAAGEAAQERALTAFPEAADRLSVIQLDVCSEQSLASAAETISAMGEQPLHALVNNAGLGQGSVSDVLDVNVFGLDRCCQMFVPLLGAGGRIVNVTSASGPNFVAQCDPEQQHFLTDAAISWEALEGFMRERTLLGNNAAYGLSKACANSYTMLAARRWPHLMINGCTPGFIETDLGKAFLGGRSPAEAGMKSPDEGARVILRLLFDLDIASGHYYGSDGQRSPLDRYRAPGSPPFTD